MKKFLYVFLFLAGLSAPLAVQAEIYALLMTIGDYQAGIPKLKGVVRDVESARAIAHLLGAKDENILQLRDGELNLEGMQRAFDELDSRVQPGDRVFVYYSGHGGRQRVNEPQERCAESLVTVDGYGLIDEEMEARLKKLSSRAQKIIAMFDACHSGGVTTRALNDGEFTPKFWSKGGESACEKPVNVLTRGIRLSTLTPGSGGSNYVYIAAARDNEVSLDRAGKGGMATTAWLECMSGARDADGSGGLTVEEIRACAQQKIDAEMKDAKGFLPQHINITGNADLVMTLARNDVPQEPVAQLAPPVQPEPVAPPASTPEPASEPLAQTPPVEAAPPSSPPAPPVAAETGAAATLADIYNGRDDRRTVEIMPARDKLRIGSDKFAFTLRSSQAGYLYLLMVGTDGKTFDLLFPNKLDGDNFIQAGQALRFPRPGWELVAQGPAGKDRLLAIVADAPRDLAKLPVANAGPFSSVAVSSSGTRGIQLVTSAPVSAMQAQCSGAKKRTLAVVQACSDAYGAALVEVEETER